MYTVKNALTTVRRQPEKILLIHYSSQSLFDEVEGGLSPRITSIAVMFFVSRQTINFSLHTIAEELGIDKDSVERRYDEIEGALLNRFFAFAQGHFDKCWMHWNMRSIIYGFEHLEHRYRVLVHQEPPTIPVSNRININDVLKYHFGKDYAPDPRMKGLMQLNGSMDPKFLTGGEEAKAFSRKEFIRMSSSTLSKVEFFRYVLNLAAKGKLKTAGRNLFVRVDRLLESRASRLVALVAAIIGIPGSIIAVLAYWL